MTSDIWLSEVICTGRIKPIQLVQLSSENDKLCTGPSGSLRLEWVAAFAGLCTVDRIPSFVLVQVADDLDLPHMDIATVRSLYQRRKRTLYEHQHWAMQLLGIDAFNEHHQRALMRAFRLPVSNASEVRAMAVDIMSWLFTRGIRIPGPRRVKAMALKVVRRAEHEMASSMMSVIPDYVLLLWDQELFAARGDGQQSQLEWLGSAPHKRSSGALDDAVAKLATLRRLFVPNIALPG